MLYKQCEADKSTTGKCMFGYTVHVRLYYNKQSINIT